MWTFTGNNAFDARLEFQNAKAALMNPDVGLDPASINDAKCTQSYLRLEQPLNTTTNIFNFPVLQNQTGNAVAVRSTENRLHQQDAFYASKIMMYLTAAASAADVAFKLDTYPNAITFATTGEAVALYAVYNGYLSLTVNGDVIIPSFPTSNFLIAPQTQLTGATNTPIDEFYGNDMVALQPNPVFIGTKNSVLNLRLPGNIAALGTFRYAVIIIQGILAQNVTLMS